MTPITDAELLEFLDGAADPDLARQIETDPSMMVRAKNLKQMQDGLRVRLHRVDCPGSLKLGEYQLGLLHGNEVLLIRQHLVVCGFCQAELAEWNVFSAPEQPGIAEHARVFLAKLVSGSLSGWQPGLAPVLGQRGVQSAATFIAGTHQILLSIRSEARRPERFSLTGLIVDASLEGAPVLLRSGTEVLTTSVDDLGNFTFGDLKPGPYDLSLETPVEEIRFPTLPIE